MIASEAPFVQSGNLARGSKRRINRVQQPCQRLIGERSVWSLWEITFRGFGR